MQTLAAAGPPSESPLIEISIRKSTNGEDAPTPPGPILAPGDEVQWTFDVKNDGDLPLNDILVVDDRLGEICTAESLLKGESITCSETGSAEVGEHRNVATVTARYIDPEGEEEDVDVSAEDVSHYTALEPIGTPTPLPTGTPSPSPTATPTESPTVQPSATPTAQSELDACRDQVETLANIALRTKRTMTVGKTERVRAVVTRDPDADPEEVLGEPGAESIVEQLPCEIEMRLHAAVSDFSIDGGDDWIGKEVEDEDQDEWSWLVTPLRLGIDLPLSLSVRGVTSGDVPTDELDTIEVTIDVDVHPDRLAFDAAVAAAKRMPIDAPTEITVGEWAEVSATYELPEGEPEWVRNLTLDAEGTADVATRPVTEAEFDGLSVTRTWEIRAQSEGTARLAFHVVLIGDADGEPLESDEAFTPWSVTANEPGKSTWSKFWDFFVGLPALISATVAAIVAVVEGYRRVRNRRRDDNPPTGRRPRLGRVPGRIRRRRP